MNYFSRFLKCQFREIWAVNRHCSLCVKDVSFQSDEQFMYVCLHLKSSKTDPGRKGVNIILFKNDRLQEQYSLNSCVKH